MENPKVFVSYSHVVQKETRVLADQLICDGVEVEVDFYGLKEGQDKYKYMEQAVSDPSIDKVLIICDKNYQEKANNRKGGVGEETIIITPEIYEKSEQEKFIPIIFEFDEENQPCVPYYIKSRIYIDLSSDEGYEAGYKKLLRNIYNKPLFKKPKLGKKPEWIENETVDLSGIRGYIRQLRNVDGDEPKRNYLLKTIADQFSEAAKAYVLPQNQPIEGSLPKTIDQTKSFRDVFMDYCETLISNTMPISQILTSNFERLSNDLCTSLREKETGIAAAYKELYDFMIWELFINTTAMLLHFELYKELHDIVTHTYLLKEYRGGDSLKPFTFAKFRPDFSILENQCKKKCDNPKPITLAGDILVKREKRPILTAQSISNADIVLYQLFSVPNYKAVGSGCWYPLAYIYYKPFQPIWQKLQSRKHCEKIFPLFGVKNLQELKDIIENSNSMKGYDNSFEKLLNIKDSIEIEKIGSLN